MDPTLHSFPTEFIGLSIDGATLNAASRHPSSKAVRIVFAAAVIGRRLALRKILIEWCPAELARPNEQSVFQ